ncbi:hypothetical protein [Mariprofundus ferrooxydans]|uniref:hypothetical protein n=1 Tax=Mariprofundus ferrooxydans TaxID=314344 RepID=UPI00035EFBC7|nr:hypothetical protein [Mariprofundus ferrooxydans]
MVQAFRTFICVTLLSIGGAISSICAAALPSDKSQLSQLLINMESPAEDMIEAIDIKKIQKLNKLYHELDADMKTLNRIIETDHADDEQRHEIGLLNSWFDQITLELNEMDDLPALANAINQFSGQLILTTRFEHGYRKNIAWMDYLGREFLLLNKQASHSPNHQALLSARRADLQATWRSVKTAIGTDAGGVALVQQVDPVIDGLMTESRQDKLVMLAAKELDLVDDIEAWFHID